jgi:hypothetical protein
MEQMSSYEYVAATLQAIRHINSLQTLPPELGAPSDDVVVMAQKMVEARDPTISVVRTYGNGEVEVIPLDRMLLPKVVLPVDQDL